jgi:hypothetical protein
MGRQRLQDPRHAVQPGTRCPAARWDQVAHPGHRRPSSRHQGLAQAAGVKTTR